MSRVAIVTHYFDPHIGGIETVAAAHAHQLARRGWGVEVHTSHVPRGAARDDLFDGIRLYRYPAANVLERSLSVPMPLVAPAMIRPLAAAAARADVVVAHGHSYLTSLYAAIAARRARRPFVLVQHNPFVEYGRVLNAAEHAADRSIGRWVLRSASVVVCVSHHTDAYVRSIDRDCRTVVVTNGIDTDRFRPMEAGSAPVRPRRAIAVRRLVPRAGIDVLLDAWRIAGFDATEAALTIAGTGPEASRLRAQAAPLAGIRFAGRVEPDELQQLYATSWVAVMPTRTGEGFGLMAAEALACGVPVIASREGALPELVRDGHNGLLVPPGDPRTLAAALRRIIESDHLRAELATNARGSISSWNDVGDRLEHELHAVISRAGLLR